MTWWGHLIFAMFVASGSAWIGYRLGVRAVVKRTIKPGMPVLINRTLYKIDRHGSLRVIGKVEV